MAQPHTFSIDEDRIVSLEGEYINVREVENQLPMYLAGNYCYRTNAIAPPEGGGAG